eukprot:GHVR01019336.1.p1 GENE.GHVR01019336.1~~GHVR01019336.1.p1  ORF type:complete len:359 (-),score=92.77 GHVR01019336.1:97-1173(-)
MTKLSQERSKELAENAQKIASKGKGILAADESTGTIGKRFAGINVENNEANRAAYRELLFTAPGIGEYISGVILFEETLFQKAPCGKPMTDLLAANGIIPGIKVDKGIVDIPQTDKETATTGLDGLEKRCAEYYKAGARFAKWRAVLVIDQATGKPSNQSIKETAYTLARYAAICQSEGLVPIVEPEILADGKHSIGVCADVTERVLAACFKELSDQKILLEGCLLKPNMVTPGNDAPKSSPDEIAFFTVRTLKRTCPPALVGVMFLSGGQSEEDASVNLNAMNKDQTHPWSLSFSYGRALQASCLKAWMGDKAKVQASQKVLTDRAKANSEAQKGVYQGGAGGAAAAGSLFEKKYVY